MKTKVRPAFNAFVKVTYELLVPVSGNTFEEAIASAQAVKPQDLPEFPAGVEINDYSIEVEGVHKQ